MNKTYEGLIIVLAVVMLSALTMPAAARQSFQGLGDLPGGGSQSLALGVSADGSVVVGFSNSASGMEAFRWTNGGGMVGLGDLPGGVFSSDARGVSANGSVVVGVGTSVSGPEAFRWTSGGGMVGLGDLPGGSFGSMAFGVSGDGSVVVGRSFTASGEEAFRWTSEGGMVGLGDLPGGSFKSGAFGVSADGSVVVGLGNSASSNPNEAFRWTSGGGMVGLGTIAGSSINSFALSVSGDGSVVVGYGHNFSFQEASIWDATNGMQSLMEVLEGQLGLDLTGWTLFNAAGVSADGTTIIGSGHSPSPNGFSEAFIAVIPGSGDSDGDGIDDAVDACPDSDLGQTIVIGGVDTGVTNELLGDGCSLADLIDAILATDPSTVDVVQFLVDLKAQGIITGRDLGATLKALNSP